jgi:hypothetical protein
MEGTTYEHPGQETRAENDREDNGGYQSPAQPSRPRTVLSVASGRSRLKSDGPVHLLKFGLGGFR